MYNSAKVLTSPVFSDISGRNIYLGGGALWAILGIYLSIWIVSCIFQNTRTWFPKNLELSGASVLRFPGLSLSLNFVVSANVFLPVLSINLPG